MKIAHAHRTDVFRLSWMSPTRPSVEVIFVLRVSR